MKRIYAFVCALALAVGTSAHAAPNGNITTFGAYDCGQWVQSRSIAKEVWLLGLLTGVNAMVASEAYDPLGELQSSAQARTYMDSYCRANPLSTVFEGAMKLYAELQEKLAGSGKRKK